MCGANPVVSSTQCGHREPLFPVAPPRSPNPGAGRLPADVLPRVALLSCLCWVRERLTCYFLGRRRCRSKGRTAVPEEAGFPWGGGWGPVTAALRWCHCGGAIAVPAPGERTAPLPASRFPLPSGRRGPRPPPPPPPGGGPGRCSRFLAETQETQRRPPSRSSRVGQGGPREKPWEGSGRAAGGGGRHGGGRPSCVGPFCAGHRPRAHCPWVGGAAVGGAVGHSRRRRRSRP